MKSLIFFLLFLGLVQLGFGQKHSYDVIYPAHGNDSISFCKIIKIRKGNQVIYQHLGIQDTVEAIAVVKKGVFIDFRTYDEIKHEVYPILEPNEAEDRGEQSYIHYQSEYKKYSTQKDIGMTFTAIGGVLLVTSFILAKNNSQSNNNQIGTITMVLAGIGINIGAPLWISSYFKAENNRLAMERCKKPEVSLNYGITENGLSLILKF